MLCYCRSYTVLCVYSILDFYLNIAITSPDCGEANIYSNTQRTIRASSQASKPRTAKQRYDDQLEADARQRADN